MRRDHQRRKGIELGVLLLFAELFNIGHLEIPPITLISIIGQALIYIEFIQLPWNVEDICISADKVWEHRNWKPIFWAHFVHIDDMHLYYNMISYLVKGRTLEKKYGSANFALLLIFISLLTSCLYVGLSLSLAYLLEDKSFLSTCAVGFSGIIFALKFITTVEYPEGYTTIAGLTVPISYATWVELIVIHVLVPNSSFVGHLAGILAGLLYIKTPLRIIMDSIFSSITGERICHRSTRFFR